MKRIFAFVLMGMLLALNISAPPPVSAHAQLQITTADQLIAAVNDLRISYGLAALPVHSLLMQSAQSQADYMAATGQVTHSRPGGTTYTQQLLALGFPLAGDLSLGGIRSENILQSTSPLVWNGVPPAWQDSAHMNTMLSASYTHIGAGITQGNGGYYYAVDTAASTGDGQMQEGAAALAGSSSSAIDGSQYILPVVKSTARADGDVLHTVQNGQTLWSIAIEYGTTIKNLQAWNNLGEDSVVYQGQVLLIQKAATAPAVETPVETAPPTPTAAMTISVPTATITVEPSAVPTSTVPPPPVSQDVRVQPLVAILIVAALLAAGVAVWLLRDPK